MPLFSFLPFDRLGKLLGTLILSSVIAIGCWLMSMPSVFALEAPTNQVAGMVFIHLGTIAGDLKFEPDFLTFVAGQRYTLVLDNPSDQKHYFTAKDFADVIWTQKVEAAGVEVKGAIHEMELKPGAEAEWVFVPQKPGKYELHCSIGGHAEAGMVGTLLILDPAEDA